jgi:DNA-binding response OmpR family regulator
MSGWSIVVADDEPDITRLIALVLQEHTILPAKNGREAFALIRETHPDLVILDVMMPGMSGLEVARALKADPETASLPIIFLSAYGQQHEVAAGLGVGAARYLVKPFEPQTLRQYIQEVLQEQTLQEPMDKKHQLCRSGSVPMHSESAQRKPGAR